MTRRTRSGAEVRSGVALAVLAAGAALALGGCQSDEAPPVTPSPSVTSTSPSPTPSPTPSASPTGSDIPATARENSARGAEAFVRYFVGQSAKAWTTPDPTLIRVLSDPDCESCTSLAQTADGLVEKGHRYEAAPITVKLVEALTGDGNKQNVGTTIQQHAVRVIDKRGNRVSMDKAATLERTFLLYWKGDQWVVGGIA